MRTPQRPSLDSLKHRLALQRAREAQKPRDGFLRETFLLPRSDYRIDDNRRIAARSGEQVLDAMARPGTIHQVGANLSPPAPLNPATAAVLLTLVDNETPLWLDEAATKAREWLDRWPKQAYWTEIESWRERPGDVIEFTMRRLPTAD